MEEYGRHLIIDLTVTDANVEGLRDRDLCAQYLDLIVELIGMQPVFPTIAMKFPFSNETCGLVKKLEVEGIKSEVLAEYSEYVKNKDDDKTGISAFSVLTTSHASIHTWPEKNYASIDIYSCLNFDNKTVEDFTIKYFNSKEIRVKNILRHHSKHQIIEEY